jgi:hypothetical protein
MTGLRAQQNPMDAHWPGNVLYLLLTHVLEPEVELVAHLIAHDPADANPARLGQGFESRSDIDSLSVDIAPRP